MRESSRRRRRASKAIWEQLFLNSRISTFGRVVIAIWPAKPAVILSQRLRCTERYANQLIRGDRRVPSRALVLVMAEIVAVHRLP